MKNLLFIFTFSLSWMASLVCHAGSDGFFLFVENEKYYLAPENVSIQQGEITVTDAEGVEIVLANLFRDELGLYTTPEAISGAAHSITNSKIWNILYCNTCKKYTTINIRGVCSVCGNPHNQTP